MNIFDSVVKYAGKWSVTSSRGFSEEEKACIKSAKIVDSQYGYSVCFFMSSGQMAFIPVDQNSACNVGDPVNLDTCKVLRLEREGDAPINRISL